jgi:hypothetical protein
MSRDRAALVATAVLAIGVPVGAAAWVAHRTDELAARLSRVAGVPARIGEVDAALDGTIRLRDVALGELIAVDAIEASVSLDSLLAGELGADEIRVAAPRVALAIDRDGDSDLARVVRRLVREDRAAPARPGASAPATSRREARAARRARRIVVTSGTLVARVAGVGELAADDVELVPDEDGVRVVTGRVRVRAAGGRAAVELVLARAAAEVALPHVRVGRVLAVGGVGTLEVGDRTTALRDVAFGRLARGGPIEVRAAIDDDGAARPIAVTIGAGGVVARGERVPLAPLAALAPRAIDVDSARATGSLALRRDGDALVVAVDVHADGARIDHRTIAPVPVPLTATVRADARITADAIAIDRGELAIGAATWTIAGWTRRNAPAGRIDVQLQPTACAAVLASLPDEIRGPLDGMALGGTLAGRARLAIDLSAPPGDGIELAIELANHCTVAAEPPAADVAALSAKRDGGWVALSALPHHVPAAFIAAEDARFYDHRGFDAAQIARSLEIDLRDRRLARGGSTISQQLVKNVFLTQRRSLDRKIQEAVLTWRLESKLDKRAILERYLNVIELGPRVWGVAAAARHWFGVAPRELTLRQAAFLAALTSEPQSMSRRVRRAGALDPDSAARVDTILRAMHGDKMIDAEELKAARESEMHFAASALKRE